MASELGAGWQGIASELRKGIVPLIYAAIGGLVVAIPTYLSSNRQMDVKMLEIAVGILAKKPEPNIEPARHWAVKVIGAYSTKVPLSPEVEAALIENRAVAPSYTYYGSYSDYSVDTFAPLETGNAGPEAPLKEPSKP